MYGDIYCTDLTHFTWLLTVSTFLDRTLITVFCNLLVFLDHLNVRSTASLPRAAARAGVTQATRRELAWLRPVRLRRRPLYSKHWMEINLFGKGSLRKHPFLLALRHWGRFARRNVMFPRAKRSAKRSGEKRMFSQAMGRVTDACLVLVKLICLP